MPRKHSGAETRHYEAMKPRRIPGLTIARPTNFEAVDTNDDLLHFLNDVVTGMRVTLSKQQTGVDDQDHGLGNAGQSLESPLVTTDDLARLQTYTAEDMELKIVDKRFPHAYQGAKKVRWNKRDVRHLEGKLRNGLDRLRFPRAPLNVTFNGVARSSDLKTPSREHELSLVPDAASPATGVIIEEHRVCMSRILAAGSQLSADEQERMILVNTFVPILPFARVLRHNSREITEDIMTRATKAAEVLLPIDVEFGPPQFFEDNIPRQI